MNPKQVVDQSQAQKRYPILMSHPQHRKATVSGYKRNPDGSATDDPPGIPGQFEDHWVYNIDQEQYYASMGYYPPGVDDPEAYRKSLCNIEEKKVDLNYPRAMYRLGPTGQLESAVAKSDQEQTGLEQEGWHTSPDKAKKEATQKVISIAAVTKEDAGQTITEKRTKRKYVRRKSKTKAKRKYTRRGKRATTAEPVVETKEGT